MDQGIFYIVGAFLVFAGLINFLPRSFWTRMNRRLDRLGSKIYNLNFIMGILFTGATILWSIYFKTLSESKSSRFVIGGLVLLLGLVFLLPLIINLFSPVFSNQHMSPK